MINKAVTRKEEKEALLYVNTHRNQGMNTLLPTRGRIEVKVTCVTFKELLDTYTPDTIKMDIEGMEYDLLKVALPTCVKSIAVEYHFNKAFIRDNALPTATHLFLLSQGFKAVKEANLDKESWADEAVYIRS